MEVKHYTRNIRVAPRKLRLITDQLKHMKVEQAIATLPLVNKGGAVHIQKSLKAAVEAAKDLNYSAESLIIQRISVDEGTALKRMIGHSRGRMAMIMKKYSHLNIVLKGEQAAPKKARRAVKADEQTSTSEEK